MAALHSFHPPPECSARTQQFRVQIRDRQLAHFKATIRQEMLRTNTLDFLLHHPPLSADAAASWAQEFLTAYACTRNFSLSSEHVLDIFRLVQKFPSRPTLQLFEVVVLRIPPATADLLFQYDVMRVLHGFISFTGMQQLVRCPASSFSVEESRIVGEAVVSSAVEAIERGEGQGGYFSRLELARASLRIISEFCRKAVHVRNFAVLNHKTYTYCLKAHKCFEQDIDNEFCAFLEAATAIPFERWEDQFTRIAKKILHLFYRQKMSVRIEIVPEEDRSYLLGYESLVKAVRNLLQMKSEWVRGMVGEAEQGEGTVTLGMVVDIVAQCNYVMEYPSAQEQTEELMPIRLLQATFDLAMRAIETLACPFPQLLRHPLYEAYARELLRFLRNREIGFSSYSFVLARRMAVFQLDQFIFELPKEELTISNFISFNPQQPQDNLISLIAYLFERDNDLENKTELCILLQHILQILPPSTFEPLLPPCSLLPALLDRLVEQEQWRGEEADSSEQTLKINILHAVGLLVKAVLPAIGERRHYYTATLSQYSQRMHQLSLRSRQRLLQRYLEAVLEGLQ